jgi:hypothetical protein
LPLQYFTRNISAGKGPILINFILANLLFKDTLNFRQKRRQNFLEEEIRELFLFLVVERALSEELSIAYTEEHTVLYVADFYKELRLSSVVSR